MFSAPAFFKRNCERERSPRLLLAPEVRAVLARGGALRDAPLRLQHFLAGRRAAHLPVLVPGKAGSAVFREQNTLKCTENNTITPPNTLHRVNNTLRYTRATKIEPPKL